MKSFMAKDAKSLKNQAQLYSLKAEEQSQHNSKHLSKPTYKQHP